MIDPVPTLRTRIDRWVERLGRALRSGRTETARAVCDGGTPDPVATLGDAEPTDEETLTRSELTARTGLEPASYVTRLLEETGGRLRQSEVSRRSRLSESTTSRLLSEMEAAGKIRRVSVGRQKVVCLPSATPGEQQSRSAAPVSG